MKKILAGLMLLVSSTAFSQLDSIDFSMEFLTNPTFTVGLDSISQQGNILQVKVFVNEPDSVGMLTVMIYDASTNTPLNARLLKREDLSTGNYTDNGFIVFNFAYLDPATSYRVILEAQNYEMNYLPRKEKYIPSTGY